VIWREFLNVINLASSLKARQVFEDIKKCTLMLMPLWSEYLNLINLALRKDTCTLLIFKNVSNANAALARVFEFDKSSLKARQVFVDI